MYKLLIFFVNVKMKIYNSIYRTITCGDDNWGCFETNSVANLRKKNIENCNKNLYNTFEVQLIIKCN